MKNKKNVLISIISSIVIFLSLIYITHKLLHINNVLNVNLDIYFAIFVAFLAFFLSFIIYNAVNNHMADKNYKSNQIDEVIREIQNKIEKKFSERNHELQVMNLQLQNEISERKTVEHQLNISKEHLVRLAHYDVLTSLPNRVFFNEILNKAISHAKTNNKIFAVLFIDLDNFNKVNDTYGHLLGDKALKALGDRFNNILPAGDIVARLGGDEFIILLNEIENATQASIIAERLLDICLQAINIDSHQLHISTSIGISLFPKDGESLEDLEKHADMAMYKAKHVGGGIFQFYSHDMDIAELEHIKLEAALRQAIKNNEFVLHFQPLLSLSDGTIKSVEALIRWEHPEIGLISPAKFIPLAEETGLIISIGEWALHEACRINKEWQLQGYDPITIAVNISPKQFRYQDVAQVVADALKANNLEAKYLKIEITESAVMENVESASLKLNSVHDMGVQISIDDFGTGYTSINYLRQYPVSVLKIDQSFIKGIPDNTNDIAITSAVIALGHNLSLEVIAEGVETVEQLQFLTEHGCDTIQGYFFSRPVPSHKLVELLTKSKDSVKA